MELWSEPTLPVPDLSQTETEDAAFTLANYTFHHLVPTFFLESFIFGITSACVILCWHAAWRNKNLSRKTLVLYVIAGGFVYILLITHWTLIYRGLVFVEPWIADMTFRCDIFIPEYAFETVLFGALSVLFSYSTHLFVSKSKSVIRSIRFWAPFFAVVVMFINAALHWIVGLQYWISNGVLASSGWSVDTYYFGYPYILSNATLTINIVLGDGVVLWRACAIWMNHRYAIWLSSLLLLATTGCNFANTIMTISRIEKLHIPLGSTNLFASDSKLGLTALGTSFLCTLFSIGAVGFRTLLITSISMGAFALINTRRLHRRDVRKYLNTGSRKLLTEKVFTLLMDSGVLYMLLWVVYFALNISAAFPLAQSGSYEVMGFMYENGMVQLIAIYPTAVIILVTLETRAHNEQDVVSVPSEFLPAQVARRSSLTSDVPPISIEDVREERGDA